MTVDKMPTFKPLVLFSRDPLNGRSVVDGVTDPSCFRISTLFSLYFKTTGDGTEGAADFTLADLMKGETVIAGITTSGHWDYGVVTDWAPGKHFSFYGLNAGSKLWSGLLMLRGRLAEEALERYKTRDPLAIRRTDSGFSYGMEGYPDVDFWARCGVESYFAVGPAERVPYDQQTAEQRAARAAELRELDTEWLSESEKAALQRQIASAS